MKLTKFQRIGIFVSLLWVLEAGYHERFNQVVKAQKILNTAQQICMDSGNNTAMTCLKQRIKNAEVQMRPDWASIASAAIFPLIIAWSLILISIKAYQWLHGRK